MIKKNNFKKSIFNWGMAAAVVCVSMIIFRPLFVYNILEARNETDIMSATMPSLGMSSFVPFAGIFPVLPYALSYVEEKNSGYYKSILLRCNKKTYVVNKVLFTGLSGGIAVALPFVLLFIVLGIFMADTTPVNHPQVFDNMIWAPYMYIWGGRLVLVLRCIQIFLFGVLWAELALLISLFVTNRYVAFILPFIIYQLGWYCFPFYINPAFLLRSDWEMTQYIKLYTPFLIMFLLCAAVITANYFVMQRKVRDIS